MLEIIYGYYGYYICTKDCTKDYTKDFNTDNKVAQYLNINLNTYHNIGTKCKGEIIKRIFSLEKKFIF
ncbi:MAG: hypothetical protein ACOCP8_10320 [archaeon]